MPLRILLADDSTLTRQRVRALLESEGFEIVGEATDGDEAVQLAEAFNPDVALLDVSMPRVSGLHAAREIRRLCPATRLILLTVHTEQQVIVRALRMGVRGYVVKSEVSEDLVRAIWEVSRGGIFLSPGAARALAEPYLPKEESSSATWPTV